MGNRLYVGNLAFAVGPEALRGAFSASGQVTDVQIVNDREIGRSRGFGFVTMSSDREAATDAMNGATLEVRALRVNEAEERPKYGTSPRGGSSKSARSRW